MKCSCLVILILTFFSSIPAQEFQFSARDGISFLSFHGHTEIQVVYFTKFSFSSKYKFDNTNKADLRFGYLIGTTDGTESYSGPELGLYYQRVLSDESGTYGFAGINTHTASGINSDSRTAVFASIGMGLPLGRIINFEIIYNQAIDENYETKSGIHYEIDLGFAMRLN